MAANDKITSLTKYVEDMKSRLEQPGKTDAYYAWVRKEIAFHTKKIEDLKMTGK